MSKSIYEIPRMETVKTTAELFHLPERFIRSKAASGEIVSVKSGNRLLINIDKLVEYLNNSRLDDKDKGV